MLAPPLARAEPTMFSAAPVDRLIANTNAYLKEHPDDPGAEATYTLGRLHFMAASLESGYVPAWERRGGDLPEFRSRNAASLEAEIASIHPRMLLDAARDREAYGRMEADYPGGYMKLPPAARRAYFEKKHVIHARLIEEDWKPEDLELSQEKVDAHMDAAIASLIKAIEVEPKSGLYRLTLASVREYYADRAAERDIAPDASPVENETTEPGELKNWWLRASLRGYAQAFMLSRLEDRGLSQKPLFGLDGLVSYEAAKHYQSLVSQLGLTEEYEKSLASITKHLEVLENLPTNNAVTPIVFTLTASHATLDDVIDPNRTVTFDLDGDGWAERRAGWPTPTTGLLCWIGDTPAEQADITSGRQLLGSVTWWVFWRDGYAAMAALDDDRDGQLAGEEFRGLGVWFDRDGDGRSDPGEVVPLGSLPIASLTTRSTATANDGRSPMHPHGLRLDDGRTLPTWDWIVH